MAEQPVPDRVSDLGRSLSPAALVWESDVVLRDALVQTLQGRGYRVMVAPSLAAAQRLLAENHFERVFGCFTSLVERPLRGVPDGSGPRVKDLRNGTARIQLDQVVPWPTAIDLLDLLGAAAAPPKRHS